MGQWTSKPVEYYTAPPFFCKTFYIVFMILSCLVFLAVYPFFIFLTSKVDVS